MNGAVFVSMWAKAAAVMLAIIPLMGSKIVIVVPEGGSVVSSSGLVACSAHETCTIDTAEHPFAETFTAVAEPGYEFTAWEDGAGAVCGGSRSEDCTELDDESFAEFPFSSERIGASSALTMSPTFAASGYDQAKSAPRFNVSSLHRTRYYDIKGETQEEVWVALHGDANPIVKNTSKGGKPAGFATFEVRYSFQPEYAENSADCRVASGTIEFIFETTLPRLVVSEVTNNNLQHRWQLFQDEVVEHEAGHIALYRQLVTQLPEAMRGVPSVSCSALAGQVRAAVARTVDAIRQANEEYDRSVGGGVDLADSRAH